MAKKVKRTIGKLQLTAVPPQVAEINALLKTWQHRLGRWKKPLKGRITLASDCCGYGSELLALRLLGLQKTVKPVMACEWSGVKNTLHDVMSQTCGFDAAACQRFENIFDRNDDNAPRADLYCAGYPCPSYSRMGRRRGTADKRGKVTLQGLKYIASRRPRAVLLEQVYALLDKNHQQVWEFIQKVFRELDYEFAFAKADTRAFGIPQSRPRLYIIAVCKESLVHPLVMPTPRETQPDLHTFLEKNICGSETLHLPVYEAKLGKKLWTHGFVLDVEASPRFMHAMKNCCPCLTKTRCKQGGYYIPKLRRRLTALEMGRFQGLPKQIVEAMLTKSTGLPNRAFEEATGDAMSINVLQTMLRRCLDASGLATLGPRRDFWLQCPKDKCFQLSELLWEKYAVAS